MPIGNSKPTAPEMYKVLVVLPAINLRIRSRRKQCVIMVPARSMRCLRRPRTHNVHTIRLHSIERMLTRLPDLKNTEVIVCRTCFTATTMRIAALYQLSLWMSGSLLRPPV